MKAVRPLNKRLVTVSQWQCHSGSVTVTLSHRFSKTGSSHALSGPVQHGEWSAKDLRRFETGRLFPSPNLHSLGLWCPIAEMWNSHRKKNLITGVYIQPGAIITKVQNNMILHTSLHSPWLGQNINPSLNAQRTPHISPWQMSYGVTFMKTFLKIDRIIMAPHCISLYF